VFHWEWLRDTAGGFVDMPLAWNADDATWALLGQSAGIGGIPEAKVSWRQSSENISNGANGRWVKLGADIAYLDWLRDRDLMSKSARRQSVRWLGARLVDLYEFRLADAPRVWRTIPAAYHAAVAGAVVRGVRRALARLVKGPIVGNNV
jgi:hypothetical protein